MGIEPAPVKAHVIVKALRVCVERMLEKSGARGRERSCLLGLLSQFIEQDRQNKGARIVVGTITLGEIWNSENRVLENACRVSHPRKVIQL